MKERYFKFRYQDYKAVQDMTDKEAGEFIKGLSKYAFDGVAFESKNAKIASAYAYAKTALDISVRNSINGKNGGLLVARRKKIAVSIMAGSTAGLDVLLKTVVLPSGETAERTKKDAPAK